MMKAAILNEDGVVVNIAKVNRLSDLPGSVDATGAKIGDTWNGSEFVAPAPVISELYDKKVEQINRQFKENCDALTAEYPDDEILSWDRQVKQAEAYQADNQTSVPLLDGMATLRNETVAVLAGKILAKAAAFEVAYGQLLGQRQARILALEAIDLESQDAAEQIKGV